MSESKPSEKVDKEVDERMDMDESTTKDCATPSAAAAAPADEDDIKNDTTTTATEAVATKTSSKRPSQDKKVSGSNDRTGRTAMAKCTKCKSRLRNAACTQLSCIVCCTDMGCEGHRKAREQAAWKEAVLKGTTPVQLRAKAKRASAVRPGSFREPGFLYMGQTITIWSLEEYMKVPKWRDDAVRRSEKRRVRRDESNQPPVKRIQNSRKRFQSAMEELYQKSISQE